MRCGLHFVRFCDLRRAKRCTGAPAGQAATQAIADALHGGKPPHAKENPRLCGASVWISPGGPGGPARLPSDQLVLDPSVPKPPGPAAPQAQEQVSAPRPEDPVAHDATGRACPAQDGARGGPGTRARDPGPDVAREQHGRGSDHECGQDKKPQDIRAFLGLGPSSAKPRCPTGAAVGAGKARKPVTPKAKRAPGGPAGQRARKSGTLPEPSGDPKGHIQHWLARGVTGKSTAPDGTPELPGKPQDQAPGNCWPASGCGTGPQPGSRSPPGAPGSSTDFPPDCLRPDTRGIPTPTPGGQGMGQGGLLAARRARLDCDRSNREHHRSRASSPSREAGTSLRAGTFSEDEDTPPHVGFIPDLFVPFPRGGGRQVLLRPGRRGTGQLEPD